MPRYTRTSRSCGSVGVCCAVLRYVACSDSLTPKEETSFLSLKQNLPRLYNVIEQLYEDLNTYYETFVALPEAESAMADSTLVRHNLQRSETDSITLIDAAELDTLIAEASGPAGRYRRRANSESRRATTSPVHR